MDGPGLRYMAVADHVAGLVESEKLRAEARLASEQELADEYGVSHMTVQRTMKELRERGIVLSVHGRSTAKGHSSPTTPTNPPTS